MQKLRALLPGAGGGGNIHQYSSSTAATSELLHRHSIALEPEVGFQITIESSQQSVTMTQPATQQSSNATTLDALCQQKASIPELNVHLVAARHLPNLFGFKIVQGYQVKVKLFPGSKRLNSSIQTNSWPKFNENFRFPLAPDIKSSLKHSSASRGSKSTVSELFTPGELFAGQFVVFTVYALLELPPASFNRFNKTYRSLRDKSSNLMQKVVESSSVKSSKEEKENEEVSENGENKNSKRKSKENSREPVSNVMTISESRRNLGSVTCYLEPKLFKRNSRTGFFGTEELWLPIKDITTTAKRNKGLNDLNNAPKGVVEIILEVRNVSKIEETGSIEQQQQTKSEQIIGNTFDRIKTALTPPTTPTTPTTATGTAPVFGFLNDQNSNSSKTSIKNTNTNTNNSNKNKNNLFNFSRNQQERCNAASKSTATSATSISSTIHTSTTSIANLTNNNNNNNNNSNNNKNQQWNRMTAEVKRKMGMSNISKLALEQNELLLRITTARMRCTQKVKDELESTAGSVYVKTAVFEHGIYVDSWKSPNFYPSLSIKWNINDDIATISIPLHGFHSLEHVLIRTTVATKTKLGKKIVLGTVFIGQNIAGGSGVQNSGALHMQQLSELPINKPLSMWHSYQ